MSTDSLKMLKDIQVLERAIASIKKKLVEGKARLDDYKTEPKEYQTKKKKQWKAREAVLREDLKVKRDEWLNLRKRYAELFPDNVPWYAVAEDPEPRNPLITQQVSPTSTLSTQEATGVEKTEATGTPPTFEQFLNEHGELTENQAFELYKEKYPSEADEYEFNESPIMELAGQILDENEIPQADPFRDWFLDRAEKYWLPSSGTFALELAETQFEEQQSQEQMDTPQEIQALNQMSINAIAEDKIKALEAKLTALAVQKEAEKQLVAVQSLPQGEVREKSLEDFVKNVLPQLLAVAGVATGGLLTADKMGLLGEYGSGSSGGLPSGRAPSGAGGSSSLDKLVELMVLKMLKEEGVSQGNRNYYSNRNYGSKRYYSNYKRSNNYYKKRRYY